MAETDLGMRDGTAVGAADLRGRVAAAEAHAAALHRMAAQDFSIPDAARLDERTRAGMTRLLEQWVETAERELLRAMGTERLGGIGPTLPLLQAAGGAADPELIGELLACVRLAQLGSGLPGHASPHPARASLVSRFVDHPAPELADAARALLLAESQGRSPETGRRPLPQHLHARLLWWVASAMREQATAITGLVLDEALCAGVRAELAAAERQVDGGVERAALRFATLLGGSPRELPQLLLEALGDRRPVLAVALMARAADIGFVEARALLLEPGAERLALALHGLDLPRDAIAQIGFALCEADPRRDLAQFVDLIDALGGIDRSAGREMLAQLRLDPDYRAARATMAGAAALR